MKVTVERAALLKSIGHVHRVVERRNTIPILANLLIRAEKDKSAKPEVTLLLSQALMQSGREQDRHRRPVEAPLRIRMESRGIDT